MIYDPKRVTPEVVRYLDPGHVFVFGSNLKGIHGAGAALVARRLFGAVPGVGEGPTGRCYALPTKRAPHDRMILDELRANVDRFLLHASRCQLTFLVVEVGCNLAGFTPKQVAPMFAAAVTMPKVWLPERFWQLLT